MQEKRVMLMFVFLLALTLSTFTASADQEVATDQVEKPNPAAAVNVEAPIQCAPRESKSVVGWLMDITAFDADAECVSSGVSLSCSCLEACRNNCYNEWWTCCSNCTFQEAMACNRALDRCEQECNCHGQCSCYYNSPDCAC